ncbi:hypothetical protein PCARR_a2564 [Pseudoalteromonas carrageenovora IAM 12662]|uniref:Transposase n=1 Tax=Pseudoalteromonas carrageenovora IAM 12662 TaxID=1314868 RepID=A0ABR9EJY6_PSEVC|nr:hypothetical protein [Pseudoalteromonas carrageenovora IAM 12662]
MLPICQQVNCYLKNYRTIEEIELKNKKSIKKQSHIITMISIYTL